MITNKMKTVQLKMREARFWPAPQKRGKDKKFQEISQLAERKKFSEKISTFLPRLNFSFRKIYYVAEGTGVEPVNPYEY